MSNELQLKVLNDVVDNLHYLIDLELKREGLETYTFSALDEFSMTLEEEWANVIATARKEDEENATDDYEPLTGHEMGINPGRP